MNGLTICVSCASRGRPRCSETMLAEAVGVSYRTVARWVSVGGVKACDVNSDRLAEVAFSFCPKETAVVLRGDVADYVRVVEVWLAGCGEYSDRGLSDYSLGLEG